MLLRLPCALLATGMLLRAAGVAEPVRQQSWPAPPPPPPKDALLVALNVTVGTTPPTVGNLTPPFSPAIMRYTVALPWSPDANFVTVSVMPAQAVS